MWPADRLNRTRDGQVRFGRRNGAYVPSRSAHRLRWGFPTDVRIYRYLHTMATMAGEPVQLALASMLECTYLLT